MPSLADELRLLEAELHHPGSTGSRKRLEQLLHPDFHEVGRSGHTYSRDTVINYLSTSSAPAPVESSDHAAHLLSENCALLTYRSAQASADGSPVNAALRSSIWLRTPQGWQLFYHQGTPMPPA